MRHLVCLALLIVARAALAQTDSAPSPWAHRPQCASAFLKSDWRFSRKQRSCDWLANGVFSPGTLVGSSILALNSEVVDYEVDRGDTYLERFALRAGQNAFKATGMFVGHWIAGEDPRRRPPYLVMKGARPSGFFSRTGRALMENLLAYRCVHGCTERAHIRAYPSFGRLLGAAAGGFGGELLITDRPNSVRRALRASLSGYGVSYAMAFVSEFTPELTRTAASVVGFLVGAR